MTEDEVKKRIAKIPPDGEWWNTSGEKSFLKYHEELVGYGLDHEVALDLLESIFYTVSGEYGN